MWPKIYGLAKFPFGLWVVPVVDERGVSQRYVGLCKIMIQFKRLERVGLRLWKSFAWRQRGIGCGPQQSITVRQAGVRGRVRPVVYDSLLKIRNGLRQALGSAQVPLKTPLQVSLVCFGVYLMCWLYILGESSQYLPNNVVYGRTDSRPVGVNCVPVAHNASLVLA